MSEDERDEQKGMTGSSVLVGAEPVPPPDPARVSHLAENRPLIVRRALLATALGGFVPLPVMDDYIAARIRAGLYMKLAASRSVDLPQSSADVLAEDKGGSAIRNATVTAATLLAIKLAWRKFFALLAVGHAAEDMATTFQIGMLVDHYCAKIHTGGPISRAEADELRKVVHVTVEQIEKAALVAVFRDGGKILGKSLLEAPRWASQQITTFAQRWAGSGGTTTVPFDAPPDLPTGAEGAWLDRAARAIEGQLSTVGTDYLGVLVGGFEERWKNRPPRKEAPATDPAKAVDPAGGGTPGAH